ncbi:MAG: L-serine ammonia-lyase, iron-sulfur-dependent, subunit alpha [Clostridia bacterium]|nr:L-serine ammonia-lyase, iron-sulfur-dependent, subunit alpha [Clostridia bacterium]
MDFHTAEELLELCSQGTDIATVMREREVTQGETDSETVEEKMKKALSVMRASAHTPLTEVLPSTGGLIGGEAEKLNKNMLVGKNICGSVMSKALIYSQAVPEMNASMGVIVAAPTAGSSGVLPAVLFALEEEFGLTEKQLLDGMFTAGAVGYLLMKNASVSGAQAGCQAEVGSASAMAAAAAVAMMGGTPEQSLDAASIALGNLLGLVCDPIAGLVEAPCQSRNAIGAANALTCAEMALSGIKAVVPFTEMAAAMLRIGVKIPNELRETALGGCAMTPTGCAHNCRIFGGCK